MQKKKSTRKTRPSTSSSRCRKCSLPSGELEYCHFCGRVCNSYRPFARTFTLIEGGPLHGICGSCAE